jgi:hypothetical protein
MGPDNHSPFGLLEGMGGRYDDQPRHETTAEILSRHLRDDAPVKSVLQRRLEFEAEHPEVVIKPPWTTESGLWEADWPGNKTPPAHDTCDGLLGYLVARFDSGDPASPD